MPDPKTIALAAALCGATAFAVWLVVVWPWGAPAVMRKTLGWKASSALMMLLRRQWSPGAMRVAVGWAVAVGCAVGFGVWYLGLAPKWKPVSASKWLDRFELPATANPRLLLVILPAVVAVEVVAALLTRVGRWRGKGESRWERGWGTWVAWALRLGLVAVTARVLLHDSIFLVEAGGEDRWTGEQYWQWLGGLAGATAVLWAAMAALTRAAPGRSVPMGLAVAAGAAGATVMYSTALATGQFAIVLSGAVIGAAVASLAVPARVAAVGSAGVIVVVYTGVLIIGRFFGDLTQRNFVVLMAAPLVMWLPELPYVRRVPAWVRGVVRVALVLIVVSVVAHGAKSAFEEQEKKRMDDPYAGWGG